MKILFASPYCLLDPTSGASISCRTILEMLAKRGHVCRAVSATIFDRQRFESIDLFFQHIKAQRVEQQPGKKPGIWRVSGNGVTYIITPSTAQRRREMTCAEEEEYQTLAKSVIHTLKPDLIMTYGGRPSDRDLYRWFNDQNIATVFYLANANYKTGLSFRDMDMIVTDTQATADLYHERLGIKPRVVGKFIHPIREIPDVEREFVTFINPSPAKGVGIFVEIAREAKRRGMAAKFLVVQSRGNIGTHIKRLQIDPGELSNISVLPVQDNMTGVWNRTKVLLCPSLWHESGARTIVEACSAGIPVLATDSGGTRELLGEAGFVFPLPDELRENYLSPVSAEVYEPWVDLIDKLTTNKKTFAKASKKAKERWKALNKPDPISRLEGLFEEAISKKQEALSAVP